ncbi:Uncharacterised protein [Mycobacteroides abscessus subsp. abscessus]|nr:Uncharacterised protein [Mycobacteroides abscessus subsp. abscessus]
MLRWMGVQSRPPHSVGQPGVARPSALRMRWVVTMSSGRFSVPAAAR